MRRRSTIWRCFNQIGLGVEQNISQAVTWYEQAAAQGYADALYALGELYATGEGVERDMDKAIAWYMQAAEQGQEEAWHKLEGLQQP